MNILKINGKEKEFAELPSTLLGLLDQMQINQATVVAEIDGNIIERSKFTDTTLKHGQSVELIRFVGGG
jgi:thiamine biosynthesis protein ThiS